MVPAPYARMASQETCSDGESMTDSQTGTAHGAFRTCGEFGQNECPGYSVGGGDPIPAMLDCLALMWAEGPGGGHHDNMAATRFTQAACGMFVTPSGSLWSVQNFWP